MPQIAPCTPCLGGTIIQVMLQPWSGCTLWTYLSHTHNALLASVVAVGDGSQPYYGLVGRVF